MSTAYIHTPPLSGSSVTSLYMEQPSMPLPLKALRPPLSLPSRATLAYNHPKTIPHDEHGHLIGLPVSQHIQKSESLMRAWLALYHTGQHGLHSELKPDKRRQGTITQYLVCRTQKPRTRPKLPTRTWSHQSYPVLHFAPHQCEPSTSTF